MRFFYVVLLSIPLLVQLIEVGRLPITIREWVTEILLTLIILILLIRLDRIYQKLKLAAYSDQLTKIANRRAFDEQLEKEIAVSNKQKKTFAVAFVDVNLFKQLNDTYGHDIGDKVLIELADNLQLICRTKRDNCFRIGGDEFVIIFSQIGSSLGDVEANLFSRINDNVAGRLSYNTSVSIGVTAYTFGETKKDLLRRADLKMYEHKSASSS